MSACFCITKWIIFPVNWCFYQPSNASLTEIRSPFEIAKWRKVTILHVSKSSTIWRKNNTMSQSYNLLLIRLPKNTEIFLIKIIRYFGETIEYAWNINYDIRTHERQRNNKMLKVRYLAFHHLRFMMGKFNEDFSGIDIKDVLPGFM